MLKILKFLFNPNMFTFYLGGDEPAAAPTNQTVTQTSIPDYAKPYVETMLGKMQALQDQPYQAYGGQRIAEFSPMQQQAFGRTANQQVAGQLAPASQMAGMAGLASLGTNYQGNQFANQYQAPGGYQTGQFGMMQTQAPSLQQYQMGPAQQVQASSFTQPGALGAYMSPYIQGALAPQMEEARRQAGITAQQQAGQAAQQGAFGGARHGIVEAENARNLGTLQSQIYGSGMQNAFQSAQGQFNAEQQASLAAQQANQQAGLTVGGQNLQALLGTQQFGAGQNLQSQLANQQAFQQAQQQQEQSRQFGYGQDMTAAQLAAQYGMGAQQATEQSKQFGATLGLQGLAQAGQMANTLGTLGQQQFGQEQAITGAQAAAGQQQQNLQQSQLQQQYQDFLTQRGYPQQQLAAMSDMLRGLPISQSTQQQYTAPPSMLSQVAGAGLAAYGATKKEGGIIKMAKGGVVKRPAGLADLAIHNMG